MTDNVTLIWFTGVISQYDINAYDLENLKINHNILERIIRNYRTDKYIAIICARTDEEKAAYTKLIKKEHLEDRLLFIFLEDYNTLINYSYNLAGMIASLAYYYHIVNYIDCSRTRLCKVKGLNIDNLIHISQLLN